MRHSKLKKHSSLHSENRHRNRNYKRKTRNLVFQIIFIIILAFVAIKFVKKEEEKPKIKGISEEEQKQIIRNEMQENNTNQQISSKSNEKKLRIPNTTTQGVVFTEATISYLEDKNQTIINLKVKNYGDEVNNQRFLLGLTNKEEKILETTYVDIQYLDTNQQTKLNIVLDKDLRETEEIQLLEEN